MWYAYATRPKSPALRGVSLALEPGKLLALVGLSGSGKSTLVSLLERHYDSTQGQVRASTRGNYYTNLAVSSFGWRINSRLAGGGINTDCRATVDWVLLWIWRVQQGAGDLAAFTCSLSAGRILPPFGRKSVQCND